MKISKHKSLVQLPTKSFYQKYYSSNEILIEKYLFKTNNVLTFLPLLVLVEFIFLIFNF